MGSGGVPEVSTIFHPRRIRGPSIILSDDHTGHGPYISPVQVVLDNSGTAYLHINIIHSLLLITKKITTYYFFLLSKN